MHRDHIVEHKVHLHDVMNRFVLMCTTVSLFACGPLPGDRGGSGGGCPPGETCSPQAPTGLFFEGETLSSHLFDIGDHPTAVGGEQRYRIFRNEERDSISVPFTIEIDGAATVVATTSTTVTLSATSSGSFQLRVLDLNDALLDSISLPAADLESAAILPTAGARFGGPFDNHEPPLYFDGAATDLVLSLRSASGRALVDNQATAAMGTPSRWDLYEGVLAREATIDVTAAGADFTAALETISSVDDVSVTNVIDDRIEVFPNSSVQPCFAAHAGTRLVYGAPWTFSLAGDGLTLGRISLERCVEVASDDAPATGTLTTRAGDRQEDFSVEIGDGNREAPLGNGDTLADRWQPMAGDRAAARLVNIESSAR